VAGTVRGDEDEENKEEEEEDQINAADMLLDFFFVYSGDGGSCGSRSYEVTVKWKRLWLPYTV
jgi:hypothetical protein